MITIGLTGGIGSGKSYVAQMFAKNGIPCYDCDSRAKMLNNTNNVIISAITERYGSQSYVGGQLNRPFIAQKIFSDKSELQWMNALVHPVVRADFGQWRSQQTADVVLVESAIMFDSGFNTACDYIVVVDAPIELRMERVMHRDGATREQVLERIDKQIPNELLVASSDYVIANNADSDIEMQVKLILNSINELRQAEFKPSPKDIKEF